MRMTRNFTLSRPYSQMGDHTGYNILERHIEAQGRHVIYQRNSIFSKYFFGFFDRYLRLFYSPPFYKSEAFFHEMYFIFISVFQNIKVLHLNGEDTAWLTVKFIPSCTYCVIHQPINWHQLVNSSFLASVRNVVCLDPQSEKYLSQAKKNVLLLAHPVDKFFFTNFYEKRVVQRSDNLNLIVVGTHRRDWAGYIRVIKFLSRFFSCTIQVVGDERKIPKLFFNFLSGYTFIVSNGLTETELRDAYAKSDVCLMFCPESTANNGLLGAIFMGLKIIINDCSSFFYYLDGYSEYYVYKGDDNLLIDFLVGKDSGGAVKKLSTLKNIISPQEAALCIDKFLKIV